MLVLGPLTALGILFCLPRWQTRLPWLLSLTLALPQSAAAPIPGGVLPAFYAVAIAIGLVLAWQLVRGRLAITPTPGIIALVVFFAWSAIVTLAAPQLFGGVPVLNQTDVSDGLVTITTLAFSTSNLSQMIFLAMASTIILFLATRDRISPYVLLPGMAACMTLSLWRLASDKVGIPFPTAIVDSGGSALVTTDANGGYRLRGVFSEPSFLAHYATASLVFCLIILLTQHRPLVRWVAAGTAAMAMVNILFARSGTALAGTALAVVLVSVLLGRAALNDSRLATRIAVIGSFGVAVALYLLPTITGYATSLISDKIGSSSYDQRSGSESFSMHVLVDTFGLGAGLGSNKPSSLWSMMLSCVGVVGTVLFLLLLVRTVGKAYQAPAFLASAAATTSIVMTKCIAGSFLSEPLMMMGIGVCAYAAAQAVRDARTDDAVEPGTPAPADVEVQAALSARRPRPSELVAAPAEPLPGRRRALPGDQGP